MKQARTEFNSLRIRNAVKAVLLGVFVLTAPRLLQAQDTKVPDTSKSRVRIGPLALNPTIELTNLGVDSNVFNEPGDRAKRDFTFTLTPKTDAWLNVGRTWLTGSAREDVVWYQDSTSERSANSFYALGWTAPLNRLGFNVQGTYLRARERPGFEIDARTDRSEWVGKIAVDYRLLSKTSIGVRGSRQYVNFDQNATFQAVNLRLELNRTVTAGSIAIKHQLTPLTAISVDAGRQQDRFERSPLRDADSTTAGVQVTFDPFALLKGSARFGYRDFAPVDPRLPRYKGTTAVVDLAYVLQGSTKVSLQVGRDLQYSFDFNQPYYLQTGFTASIAQQIYGPVDAVVRAGQQHLAYRDRAGGAVAVPNRVDRVQMFGGGLGYHIGRELRIGFNIDRQRRLSDDFFRTYDGYRFGTSVTYGL